MLELHSSNYLDLIELELLNNHNLYSYQKSEEEQGEIIRNLIDSNINEIYTSHQSRSKTALKPKSANSEHKVEVKLSEHFTTNSKLIRKKITAMLKYLGNSSDLDVIPPKMVCKKESVLFIPEEFVQEDCQHQAIHIKELLSSMWEELLNIIANRNQSLISSQLSQINWQEENCDTNISEVSFNSSLFKIIQELNLRNSILVELFSIVMTDELNMILNSLVFKKGEIQTLFYLIIETVYSAEVTINSDN